MCTFLHIREIQLFQGKWHIYNIHFPEFAHTDPPGGGPLLPLWAHGIPVPRLRSWFCSKGRFFTPQGQTNWTPMTGVNVVKNSHIFWYMSKKNSAKSVRHVGPTLYSPLGVDGVEIYSSVFFRHEMWKLKHVPNFRFRPKKLLYKKARKKCVFHLCQSLFM